MKLDDILSTVQEAILANGGSKELAAKTLNDIRKAAEEEKGDRKATGPKAKHDFLFLASDPNGLLKDAQALVGWVFQVETGANPAGLVDRVKAAAAAFNNSRKGRRHPVTTVGEALEGVPAKWWKTDDGKVTRVKTKVPTYLVTTDNRLS